MCGSCQAKRTQAGNGDDSSFGANYGRRQQRRQKEMTWGRCGEAEWANWARTQVVCAELHLMAVYGQTVRTPESAVSSKASTRSSARHHASCENTTSSSVSKNRRFGVPLLSRMSQVLYFAKNCRANCNRRHVNRNSFRAAQATSRTEAKLERSS